MEDNVIVGIDIGTTKIGVVIAEVDEYNKLKIVGVGTHPSHGLRRGVVINVEHTVASIQSAVEIAERMAGVEVRSAYTGIAGDHIRSLNSHGVIAVSRDDNEITYEDVKRVIEAAKAVALPIDREMIHVLPQEYIVDDQKGIREPIGMSGIRLEAKVHIVTGAITSAQNIYKSVQRAGIDVEDIVLEPLASSYAVLDQDEKELGVGLLDMGGGTTDLAMFFEGSIRHTGVIGLGGKNVTNDIALGLRTPPDKAEEIKLTHGCAKQSMVHEDEVIEVQGLGGRAPRMVSRSVLSAIIEPRMEEIFSMVRREIQRSDYIDLLTAGIVLTGGASLLEGCIDLAEEVLDIPVKLGIPKGFGGLVEAAQTPIHATGVGLALYGMKYGAKKQQFGDDSQLFDGILNRMKKWFDEFF